MRPTVPSLAVAGLLLAASAMAQSETPVPTATPDAAPTAPIVEPAPVAPSPKPQVSTGASKLKIGGVLFAFYRYSLTEGTDNRNEFDIGRAYVNILPSLGDDFDARITTDILRQGAGEDSTGEDVTTNTTGSLVVRLKYAYLTYHFLPFLDLTVGQLSTPWVGFEEDVWGYRVLDSTAPDKFYGVSSSDFGFSAKARFGKRVEIVTNAQNGEGYSKTETNKYKEVATRATVTVLPNDKGGLKLSGYYGYGLTDEDADKVRGIGMVSYQSALFTVAGAYLQAQNGDGMGTRITGGGPYAFASFDVPVTLPKAGKPSVFARFDLVDPDADTEDDSLNRLIAGIAFRGHDKVRFIVDYQQISYENTETDPLQVAFMHWEAKF